MDWEALRDDFPGLSKSTYLNSCSLGQPPQVALDAHQTFLQEWMRYGASAWYEAWVGQIQAWRETHAKLLGAKPSEVAWVASVSQGLGSIASSLARTHGELRVAAYEQEFPTVRSVWGPRPGTTILEVPGQDAIDVPLEGYQRALDEGANVLVASRVLYNSGASQDMDQLQRMADEAGAFLVCEDYHGTGQLDLRAHDVGSKGLQSLAGGCLKWLCGGMAAGFLYVREDLIESLEPQHSGWWANEDMFQFDNRSFQFWKDARRFEMGEVNMHAISLSLASTRYLLDLGMPAIEARNKALRLDLLERLADAGMEVRVRDPATHTNLIMVNRPDAKADVARLAKQNIIVDDRPGAVRVSPHFYNTFEENEAFVAALKRSSA